MEYLQISRTRLTAIADQTRRLGGVEGSLSPAQIEAVLSSLSASGGSGGSGISFVTSAKGSIPDVPKVYVNSTIDFPEVVLETSAVGLLTE